MMYLIEAASDVGNRKKINQDSLCYMRGRLQDIPCAMAVVCDGMGGKRTGISSSSQADRIRKAVPDQCGDR